MFKRLLEKEKHGATFATLGNNLVSNGILTDAKTTKSNAFFQFTVAARANLLPTPAKVEQWYRRPRSPCLRCGEDAQSTLAYILNGCRGNFAEMTCRHNKVVEMVRRAIVENMVGRIHSAMGENVIIQEEGLSDAVRSLRPDLSFIAVLMGAEFMVLIDISCPFGRISYGGNTLKKIYVDKLEKYTELARELQRIRGMLVQIISVLVSSLRAVHAELLDELEGFFSYSVKVKKIGETVI
jgi:hypothetical protein